MRNKTSKPTPTNAASSGVMLDRKLTKQLMQRSDRPALLWLAQWVLLLVATGYLLHLSEGTAWFIPMLIVYGSAISVPAYALSHECAHGTAFRTRWINEVLFWISSAIYYEEPYYRRYAHASHHTYTWFNGLDAQMPYQTPMTFSGWLLEVTGIAYFIWITRIMLAATIVGDAPASSIIRDLLKHDDLVKLPPAEPKPISPIVQAPTVSDEERAAIKAKRKEMRQKKQAAAKAAREQAARARKR